MGLFSRLLGWEKRRSRTREERRTDADGSRRCRFETMEPRRMLDADPLFLGVVYTEADQGSDTHPDTFEVTYYGGSPTTELSQLKIHANDIVYFDTAPGGLGAGGSFPFQFDAARSVGIVATDILSFSVQDGGHDLVISFKNFQAGDKLVFTIDVDEAQGLRGDPIASAAEWELSTIDAVFTDPHYSFDKVPDSAPSGAEPDGDEHGIFWDFYDDNFAAAGLTGKLPGDEASGLADRIAGAELSYTLKPLPVTISGRVFHDKDLDLVQDIADGEQGIANVTLSLFQKDDTGAYVRVLKPNGTALTTKTDANGDYSFGINDGVELLPGTYRVVETQPAAYKISVGAIPGTIAPDGLVTGKTSGTNVLTEITIPLGDQHAIHYDFAEVNPVEISGHIHLSQPDGNCFGLDPSEYTPLAGVKVYLVSDRGNVYSTNTDAQGNYSFTSANLPPGQFLLPGTYTVIEVTPENLFDGDEHVGEVNGQHVGTVPATTPSQITLADGSTILVQDFVSINELGRLDFLTQVTLASGDAGVHYDFCEYEPSSLAGNVFHDVNENGQRDTGDLPIAGVELVLLDSAGNTVATTTTNAAGQYEFNRLRAGNYMIVEVQPNQFFDGKDIAGTIHSVTVGAALANGDKINNIQLGWGQNGINYDFGELLGSLSGRVQLSTPGGDCPEPGQPGYRPLAGVSIYLVNENGATLHTTTDAGGNYFFNNLAPGNYSIIEITPTGLFDGADHVGHVNGAELGDLEGVVSVTQNGAFTELLLDSGEIVRVANFEQNGTAARIDVTTGISLTGSKRNGADYNFCEHEPSSLAGNVFHDVNQNGQRDAGDLPIAGVELVLLDSAGNVVATTTTNSAGKYNFTNLRAGNYMVVETQPERYFDGNDIAGTINSITVGQAVVGGDKINEIQLGWGQDGVNYDFGELRGSLSGHVQLSTPGGDCLDPSDPNYRPLAGVSVYLVNESGETLHTTSDANGYYLFDDIGPGSYSVIEITPTSLFDGTDHVGTVNGAEVGALEGVVSMTKNGAFTELVLGNGKVVRVADFEQLGDVARIDVTTQIELTFSDLNAVNYDFCEHEPSSLMGTVFHDVNADGQRNAGDLPIAGVEVVLLDSAGDVVSSTITNAVGKYTFNNLRAGNYMVVEVQPHAYFDGTDSAGTINGVKVGQAVAGGDKINNVQLGWGQMGINYDFGELLGSLSGNVQLSSPNGDCLDPSDPNYRPLEGVSVYLVNEFGATLHTTTDANGHYVFNNIGPGSYSVIEITPTSLFDGDDHVGTVNGVELGDLEGVVKVTQNGAFTELLLGNGEVVRVTNFEQIGSVSRIDVITNIEMTFADRTAENYDFCEHEPSSLAGHVFVDANDNGIREANETLLSGVQVILLNANGQQVGAAVTTNAKGEYQFNNLRAGVYTVVEAQPAGYFDGKESVGTISNVKVGVYERFPDATGVIRDADKISAIALGWGQHGVNYDFGEVPPSSLSGYVYYDRNDNGVRDDGEEGIGGVQIELRTTFESGGSVLLTRDHVLDPAKLDAGGRYVVTTDSNGFYQFTGLRGGVIQRIDGILLGNYTVYENVQPPTYNDGLDSPGTTGGLADNSNHESAPQTSPLAQAFIQSHTAHGARQGDLLFFIPVGIGQSSANNNFGEVRTLRPLPPPPPPPVRLEVTPPPPPFILPPQIVVPPPPVTVVIPRTPLYGSGGTVGYTWHLSVVDAGQPRGFQPSSEAAAPAWMPVSYLARREWTPEMVQYGRWTLRIDGAHGGEDEIREVVFGIPGAIPVVGDFNGDGIDEVALYVDGEWFLDVNGNNVWDEGDLWAKLGDKGDRPITGDWNGDGKDDIGIYGPKWPLDPRAIEREPGLPDPLNAPKDKPKNMPPGEHEATSGRRLLRLSRSGRPRADVIDHVFRYGRDEDIPVTGDWDGDGIKTIGVFRNGKWLLDMDGDGQWSAGDIAAKFGEPGDLPVVGDFNGDGIDEIGVYRAGTWIIDVNRNREMDAHDKVFELGGAGDLPVVGDWNGDGIDDVGLYHETAPPIGNQARN